MVEDKGFFNRQPHQKVASLVTRLAQMTTLFIPFTLVPNTALRSGSILQNTFSGNNE